MLVLHTLYPLPLRLLCTSCPLLLLPFFFISLFLRDGSGDDDESLVSCVFLCFHVLPPALDVPVFFDSPDLSSPPTGSTGRKYLLLSLVDGCGPQPKSIFLSNAYPFPSPCLLVKRNMTCAPRESTICLPRGEVFPHDVLSRVTLGRGLM